MSHDSEKPSIKYFNRKGMSGQRSTRRFSRIGMSMGPNLESPPPRKTMTDGYLFLKGKNSMGERGGASGVSPVVNVHVCYVHPRGSWNNPGGLFGFFSKREKKILQTSAYNSHHHSRASTNWIVHVALMKPSAISAMRFSLPPVN